MSEIWRPIPGYPYYQASSQGRIRSLPRWTPVTGGGFRLREGSILKQVINTTGRKQVLLFNEGKRRTEPVHRIVCGAFYGPAPSDRPWALHRNGDHLQNTPRNLYWGTPSENAQDMVTHGTHRETQKDVCSRGHAKTDENMYVRPDGRGRMCRACSAIRGRNRSRNDLERRTLDRLDSA